MPAATVEPSADWEARLEAEVDALLEQLSVADRVGQLFVVIFPGNDTGYESDIAELIHGYRIGGVLLTPRTGNFTNQSGADTPGAVASLANRLQALAYGVLLPTELAIPDAAGGDTVVAALPGDLPLLEEVTGVAPVNLPLFVAVEQLGDHLPQTALRRGFTPLPSQMALGAAWNPELTRRVGTIAGFELAAVGANLMLGPNLNVVEPPRLDEVGSRGLHSFGGDPYWVAQQARAYIAGVHEGGGGRVATVAGHFPGAGDIDRLPEQEIATVQRSLEQLRRQALPPFWAVTRRNSSLLSPLGDPSATAAMATSPTRYSAFQGGASGRATPLNLTPELAIVLEQEGFTGWVNGGGILMSPPLGLPSIRRYYNPAQEEFPYRRVALDAFTAGHDLLVLDQFGLDGTWETQMRNMQATIGFFQERYINDPTFAQQVDESVRRILRLKLRLYGVEPGAEIHAGEQDAGDTLGAGLIPLDQVLVSRARMGRLSNEHRAAALAVVGQVARESLTTLYPDPAGMSEILSQLPQANEQIVIFTESRLLHECQACLAEPAVGPDELAEIMLGLYGPGATGQLAEEQITSLTFADLAQVLESSEVPTDDDASMPPESPLGDSTDADENGEDPPLDKNAKINMQIEAAEWIIFAMLDVDEPAYPYSGVVKQFLRERGDALASKHLVVFALHAPYFLDATEISKLHAYYGVYGKTQPFIENAVRGFFRSYTPAGAPPVSVAGTRFADLLDRTEVDAGRSLELRLLDAENSVLLDNDPEESSPLPAVEAGATIRIQAGPLVDANGKIVHDGTPVTFVLAYEGDESPAREETALTRGGYALREVIAERGGTLTIHARAGEARSAQPLLVGVQGESNDETEGNEVAAGNLEEDASVEADQVPPVGPPGVAAADTLTVPALAAPVNVVPDGVGSDSPRALAPGQRLSLATFVLSLFTMAAALGLLLVVQIRLLPRRILVQGTLWAVICGLTAYVLYGVGLTPFGGWLAETLRIWGAVVVVLVGMLPALIWLGLRTE